MRAFAPCLHWFQGFWTGPSPVTLHHPSITVLPPHVDLVTHVTGETLGPLIHFSGSVT